MPVSNSVLRRYTPPTCTLEIVANRSPLSQWLGQSVLKDLHFELRFDDPRKTDDERVTIQGNADELDVLYEAVNSYVHDFLNLSSTPQAVALGRLASPNPATSGDGNNHSASKPQNLSFVNPYSPQSPEGKANESSSVLRLEPASKRRSAQLRTAPSIYLQPQGLVSHTLFLGPLATQESGSAVHLSALQLFDLATALEEYASELVALPNLKPFQRWQTPPAWARVAAVVVLAVGVTTAAVKYLNQPYQTQEAAAPEAGSAPNPANPTPPSTAQAPTALPSPPASPLPTPTIPTPLAASPVLPPPSPVIIPTAPTDPAAPTGNAPTADQRPTVLIAPPPSRTPVAPSRIVSPATPSQVASAPKSPASSESAPPSPSAPAATQQRASLPGGPATPPPLPNLPSLASPRTTAPEANQDAPGLNSRSAPTSRNRTSLDSNANRTLFDNIPQVAEARSYFQQRWQPPADLTQTLEYTLVINADGSIERIIPLGRTAVELIERVGIPAPGEPFVSAIEGGKSPRIRLVFTPDGEVKTFLESIN